MQWRRRIQLEKSSLGKSRREEPINGVCCKKKTKKNKNWMNVVEKINIYKKLVNQVEAFCRHKIPFITMNAELEFNVTAKFTTTTKKWNWEWCLKGKQKLWCSSAVQLTLYDDYQYNVSARVR